MSKKIFDLNSVRSLSYTESNWIKFDVEISYNSLLESIVFHEIFFKENEEKFKNRFDNDEQTHYQMLEDRSIQTLKNTLRNSSLLSSFAIFESILKDICVFVETETNSKIKHSDLSYRNGDIGQLKLYLTKVFGMTFTVEIDNLLNQINEYKFLRNSIAHYNGKILTTKNPRLNKFRKWLKVVDIESNYSIFHIQKSDLLKRLISLMTDFFNLLIYEVDNHLKQKLI